MFYYKLSKFRQLHVILGHSFGAACHNTEDCRVQENICINSFKTLDNRFKINY